MVEDGKCFEIGFVVDCFLAGCLVLWQNWWCFWVVECVDEFFEQLFFCCLQAFCDDVSVAGKSCNDRVVVAFWVFKKDWLFVCAVDEICYFVIDVNLFGDGEQFVIFFEMGKKVS